MDACYKGIPYFTVGINSNASHLVKSFLKLEIRTMPFTPLEIEILNSVIQARKSIAPNLFIEGEISDDVLTQILENAMRAPTHRLTQPWHFTVIRPAKTPGFAQQLADKYKESTPAEKFQQNKYDGILKKVQKSSVLLIIKMRRDAEERIPEWEEVAAVAMAVQNIYLSCAAHGIGGYWSSPQYAIEHMSSLIKMEDGEKCLGVFYIGYYDKKLMPSPRSPLAEKVTWHQ